MLHHQHNILTQIGIDIWIPKSAQVKEYSAQSVWRHSKEKELDFAEDTSTHTFSFDEQAEVVETLSEPRIEAQQVKKIEPQNIVNEEKNLEQKQQSVNKEIKLISNVERFVLTAFSYREAIILTSYDNLNDHEHKLLQAITAFCKAVPLNLSWPLPFENLQDPDYIKCYIQGFLDQFGRKKTIIILGSIPIKIDQAIYTVSLQEMIEQPALKCELWTLLKDKNQQVILNEEGDYI